MSLSRHGQLQWRYSDDDPDDNFNKRIGTILNRGTPMHARPSTAPVNTRRRQQEQQQQQQLRRITPPAQTVQPVIERTENGLPDFGNQGHGWVDEKGTCLTQTLPPSARHRASNVSVPSLRPSTCVPSNRRTQELWKKMNPGIMEEFIKTPSSTAHEHFQVDEELLDHKTLGSWQNHRTKTDFSQYVEADSKLKLLVKSKNAGAI